MAPVNGDEGLRGYPDIFLDILFARTVQIPVFEGFTCRRTIQLPIEPEHLPYLGMYWINDKYEADGEPNHGTVRFKHFFTYGFSVQMEGNEPLMMQTKLLRIHRAICENLWRDQYMMNMLGKHTYNPHTGMKHEENLTIEGIQRGNATINWGSIGNNETPWAELQFEMTLIFRSYWEPIITDDLLEVNVRAVPMIGRPGEMHPADEYVQRILKKYEFDPEKGSVPTPLTGEWERS